MIKAKVQIITYHIQLIEVVNYKISYPTHWSSKVYSKPHVMDKYMSCEMAVWVSSIFEKAHIFILKLHFYSILNNNYIKLTH